MSAAAAKQRSIPLFWGYFVCLLMIMTAVGTAMVMPAPNQLADAQPPDLETILPESFAAWSRVQISAAVLPTEAVIGPGEAVAYRAYRNSLGRIVTLVVAYGPPASDSVRLHRPETCYVGQGFYIERRGQSAVRFNKSDIPVTRLMTNNGERSEAVSYWLRAGDDYATSAAAHQWINLRQGLGRRADGVLVRISTSGAADVEFELHRTFIADLLNALSPDQLRLLIANA